MLLGDVIQSPPSAVSFKNGTALLFFPFLPALMEVCLVLGAVQLLPPLSSFFSVLFLWEVSLCPGLLVTFPLQPQLL